VNKLGAALKRFANWLFLDDLKNLLQPPNLWFILVIGVPFGIYGFLSHFESVFLSGGASLFVCFTIIAALAESIIVLIQKRQLPGEALLTYVIMGCLFGWNMYYAVTEVGNHSSDIDVIVFVPFSLGLLFAWVGRWIVDPEAIEKMMTEEI
jgi:hypothetical protein